MASYLVNPRSPRRVLSGQTLAANGVCNLNAAGSVNSSGGPVSVFAPPAAGEGECFAIIDSGLLSATNAITINGNGNTIDGAATATLSINGGVACFVRDAAGWIRVAPARAFDDDDQVAIVPTSNLQGVVPGGLINEVQLSNGAGGFISATRVEGGTEFLRFGSGLRHSTAYLRFSQHGGTTRNIIGVVDGAGGDRGLIRWGGGVGDTIEFGFQTSPIVDLLGDTVRLGSASGTRVQIGSASIDHRIGGVTKTNLTTSLYESAVPRVGMFQPYASEGRATQAMADANQTAAASVYSRRIIRTTGLLTANRELTLPTPGSEDASYEKIIENDCTGAFSLVVRLAAGVTVSMLSAQQAIIFVTPDGVEFAAVPNP